MSYYPPPGQPGNPPQDQPGYPPQGQPGYPPAGYPPQGHPGYQPQGQPGYQPQGQPGYPPGAPPYQGGAVPPYQQYQPPLPGQPGYQWGAGVLAYNYAGFWQRVGARLLDGLIIGVPLWIIFFIIIGGAAGASRSAVDSYGNVSSGFVASIVGLYFFFILIAIVVALLYEALLTGRQGAHNGQTLGKQIVGIRITNLQGGPITMKQAWGRFLFLQFVINGIGSIFLDIPPLLNVLWMLWDPAKQCWHDKIANTLVLQA